MDDTEFSIQLLIHLLTHVTEINGQDSATVDLNVLVVLDAAKCADVASEWSLEDADFVAYVFEDFAVGNEGHLVCRLRDRLQELTHLGIRNDYNATNCIFLHFGHLIVQF